MRHKTRSERVASVRQMQNRRIIKAEKAAKSMPDTRQAWRISVGGYQPK